MTRPSPPPLLAQLGLTALLCSSACHDTTSADPCALMTCGDHGRCLREGGDGPPSCRCDEGFSAQGGLCVAAGDADLGGDADLDEERDADLEEERDAELAADANAEQDAGCRWSAFGPAINLESVNSVDSEATPFLSARGKSLYFSSDRAGSGDFDLYLTKRDRAEGPFEPPLRLTKINSERDERSPSVTGDGLNLFYEVSDGSPSCHQGSSIWYARRERLSDPFEAGWCLAALDSERAETSPEISSEGLVLYFVTNRGGGASEDDLDIYSVRRLGLEDDFEYEEAVRLGATRSDAREGGPSLTEDGLTLVFHRDHGDPTTSDLFIATRADGDRPFDTPRAITELNSGATDRDPDISEDGRLLIFASSREGSLGDTDLWIAERSWSCD